MLVNHIRKEVTQTAEDEVASNLYALAEIGRNREEKLLSQYELNKELHGKYTDGRDTLANRKQMLRKLRQGMTMEEKLSWLDRVCASFIMTSKVEPLISLLDTIIDTGDVLQNLRVVGKARSGKTWATKYYSAITNYAMGYKKVLHLEVKESSRSLKPLYQRGCASLGYPVRGQVSEAADRFVVACLRNNVKMLILDEAANINTANKRLALKWLYNELQIPIIAVTADPDFFGTDEQLAGRFEPKYTLNDYAIKELEEIVKTIESYLPFPQPSYLSLDKLEEGSGETISGPLMQIWKNTGGRIGKVKLLIKTAAIKALSRDGENITMKDLYEAWDLLCMDAKY